MSIMDLGWDAFFQSQWNASNRGACVPGRVVSQHRGVWRVAGDFQECWAKPSGKLRLEADNGAHWPAVGDWVAVEMGCDGSNAMIHGVLPRRSAFVRKTAGKALAQQVIAANIDLAFIVASMDGDFNPRRIERYIAQCWESGARPAIVLNKADACATPRKYADAIADISMEARIFVVSAKSGEGMNALEAMLADRQTVVFLGSSGVGKSTIVNWLLHEARQTTQPVREKDSRGRHTTTSRQLFMLPNGALVIDAPGLRELQLWDAGDGISRAFADIEELATRCRFRDCQHQTEPGCAVRAALEDGALDAGRLENKRKLEREQEFLLRKSDPEKQHEYRKRIKIIFRSLRQDTKSRFKDKN